MWGPPAQGLAGRMGGKTIINMLRKELTTDKDADWLEILFPLLRWYYHTELYHGYSPNQLVFDHKK